MLESEKSKNNFNPTKSDKFSWDTFSLFSFITAIFLSALMVLKLKSNNFDDPNIFGIHFIYFITFILIILSIGFIGHFKDWENTSGLQKVKAVATVMITIFFMLASLIKLF